MRIASIHCQHFLVEHASSAESQAIQAKQAGERAITSTLLVYTLFCYVIVHDVCVFFLRSEISCARAKIATNRQTNWCKVNA